MNVTFLSLQAEIHCYSWLEWLVLRSVFPARHSRVRGSTLVVFGLLVCVSIGVAVSASVEAVVIACMTEHFYNVPTV